MLKTGLEYDTFHVHSQKSLESKTYVMFIASIVRNRMFQQLKQVSLKEKDKKNYTVPATISELEKSYCREKQQGCLYHEIWTYCKTEKDPNAVRNH